MPGKKKQFINKKEAVTFHLVHRSQKDPLQASEDASKHVLIPDNSKQLEEQQKYGVFYDDNYNYMQHLKESKEAYDLAPVKDMPVVEDRREDDAGPSLQLPASIFPSAVEKEIGLLNESVPVRGPQPDWDPDIVEAMDDDFDFDNPDNQMEDNFILRANKSDIDGQENGQVGVGDDDHDSSSDNDDGSDIASDKAEMSDEFDEDFQPGYGDGMFMDEETKSQFTNYSISSSVIRRNEGLTLLDDRFEKLYEAYDEGEIGALDQDDIAGTVEPSSTALASLLSQFEEQQNPLQLSVDDKEVGAGGEEDVESDTELVKVVVDKPREQWDCESILSTYSTLYNHPTRISEPRKEKKNKDPELADNAVATRGLTKGEINIEIQTRERSDKASTYRPKDETTEERNERKKALKQERMERRQEKKSNKKAFQTEKLRLDKEVINLQANVQNVKIV